MSTTPSKFDGIKVSGQISVFERRGDAPPKLVLTTPNMVVDLGLSVLCELMIQASSGMQSAAYNKIATIYVGGRATGTPDTAGSTPPLASQTGLQGTLIARLPITEVTNVATTTAEFRATLDTNQGNSFDVQELALYTRGSSDVPTDPNNASQRMFARQVIGTLSKTPDVAFEFVWRIRFAAAV